MGPALWSHGVAMGMEAIPPTWPGLAPCGLRNHFCLVRTGESYLPLPVICLRILCFSYTWSSMPQLLQGAPEPQMTSQ